jgi:hypothetical protein
MAVGRSARAPDTADRRGDLVCGDLVCGDLVCGDLVCGDLACGDLVCGDLVCGDLALLASPLGRCDGDETSDVFFSAPGFPLDSPLAAVCLGCSFGVVELPGAGWAAQQPSVLPWLGACGEAAALGEALGTIASGGMPVVFVAAPDVGLAWSGLAAATGIHPKTSAQQPRMTATARRWRRRMDRGCSLVSLAISRSAPISSPERCSRARMRAPRRVSGRSRTLRPAPKTRRSSAQRAACRRSPAVHRRRGSA